VLDVDLSQRVTDAIGRLEAAVSYQLLSACRATCRGDERRRLADAPLKIERARYVWLRRLRSTTAKTSLMVRLWSSQAS